MSHLVALQQELAWLEAGETFNRKRTISLLRVAVQRESERDAELEKLAATIEEGRIASELVGRIANLFNQEVFASSPLSQDQLFTTVKETLDALRVRTNSDVELRERAEAERDIAREKWQAAECELNALKSPAIPRRSLKTIPTSPPNRPYQRFEFTMALTPVELEKIQRKWNYKNPDTWRQIHQIDGGIVRLSITGNGMNDHAARRMLEQGGMLNKAVPLSRISAPNTIIIPPDQHHRYDFNCKYTKAQEKKYLA